MNKPIPLPIITIYTTLLDYFGYQHWWPASTDYEMLIGAILTQNTHWKNAKKALINLGKWVTPQAILRMDEKKLAELIRPSGYYNQKAKRIQCFTRWLVNFYEEGNALKKIDSKHLRNRLLTVNGIGPETADCMLVYAFNKPVFIIDTYTRRLFERLGYVVPSSYDAFQLQIEQAIGDKLTLAICNEFHALIVMHAKQYCKTKPDCHACPLNQHCCYYYSYRCI